VERVHEDGVALVVELVQPLRVVNRLDIAVEVEHEHGNRDLPQLVGDVPERGGLAGTRPTDQHQMAVGQQRRTPRRGLGRVHHRPEQDAVPV
jgi:hypothetical protein